MTLFDVLIRSGREAAGLRQDDLASLSGVSISTIQRLEAGQGSVTARTQAKLSRALEKKGVILTERGLEIAQSPVYRIEEKTEEACYLQLLDDVAEHLETVEAPELLIMFADDRVSTEAVNERYRALRRGGVAMRQLVEAGNTYLLGPVEEYRWVPSARFINRVTLIFGDCVAQMAADPRMALVRIDPVNAAIARNSFELHWDYLDQPTGSEADARF